MNIIALFCLFFGFVFAAISVKWDPPGWDFLSLAVALLILYFIIIALGGAAGYPGGRL